VKVDLESDHNFYTGLAQDISGGGLFVATHHLRRIGERVSLEFRIPDEAIPIAVDAEVRWVREITSLQRFDGPAGMGLKFTNLSANASAAIERFLTLRDPLFYDDE